MSSSSSDDDDDEPIDNRFSICAISYDQLIDDQMINIGSPDTELLTNADRKHNFSNSDSSKRIFAQLLEKSICSEYDFDSYTDEIAVSLPPSPVKPIKIFEDSNLVLDIDEMDDTMNRKRTYSRQLKGTQKMIDDAVLGVMDDLFGFDPYKKTL
ncbi:hypothetical protein ACOME3_001143 [Neoechinorhynchus agilis]